MRKIGRIEDSQTAVRFSDYLYAQGIANEVDGAEATGWGVWVLDEEQLEAAGKALAEFRANPEAATYRDAGQAADVRRHAEARDAARGQKRVYDRKRILGRSLISLAPLTLSLIVISVAVTLLGGLGSKSPLTQWLSITPYEIAGEYLQWDSSLPEIRHGQLWRLVTPIFIHASILASSFGLLHILFNMLWLKDLGQMLERTQGKQGLLTKVLVLAVLSNLGQFFLAGPSFGGMSGVVYGLLGYAWMRGRFDLTSGLFVHSQTVMMMTMWFLLCLGGMMGPIANGAHGVGLVVGIVWGYASAYRVNMRHA